jgi:hypothetical protein
MFTSKKNEVANSRQQIAIDGAKNNILILPNNHYQTIIEIAAINFELKSDEEQDAIIDSYESFLNSCNCPLQIITRIRQVDINKYIDDLNLKYGDETNKIYRQQLVAYIQFIKSLITTNRILTRKFYLIIPYIPTKKVDFQIIEEHLNMQTDIIIKSISRIGISSRRLDNLEMLDLFYSFYNQQRAKNQPLTTRTLNVLQKFMIRSKE